MSNRGLNSNVPRQESTATSSSLMLSGMRREKEAPVGLDIDNYSTDPGKVPGKGSTKERMCLEFPPVVRAPPKVFAYSGPFVGAAPVAALSCRASRGICDHGERQREGRSAYPSRAKRTEFLDRINRISRMDFVHCVHSVESRASRAHGDAGRFVTFV